MQMGLLTLFCVTTVAFTGLTSGAGVLPEDSVNAAVGGSVMFNTSLTPAQTPLYYISWNFKTTDIVTFLGGATVIPPDYKDRITPFTLTGSLELRNVSLNDTGEYTVSIGPTEGDAPIPGNTILNVYEPVSDVRLTANNTDLVEFNDSVTLSCSASGSSLSFLWFKDSIEVTASNRVNITDGGATLTIVTVWRTDHGSYTCEVSNLVSNPVISNQIQLSVSYGPDNINLTTDPSGEYHKEGSDVFLSCSADSRPDAQFKWFLNGEMSSTGEEKNLVNIQMDQSGNYSCQAFNSKTLRYTTSQPAPVSVLKIITNISANSSSNQPVEGTSLDLTCDASGSIFTREWMINGTELKPSGNIVFYDQKRVLSFRVLNRKDNGKYTCNISNPISSQSVNYTVSVNYGPDTPEISGPEKVHVGTTLKLRCSAESVPTAIYTWTQNGTTVAQSPEYTKDKTVLSDSGEYTCRATNDITKNTSEASHLVHVTEIVARSGCSTGCIVGIVFGCIAVILLVSGGVFFALKKKKQKTKSNSRTDGEGRDNSAYAQNQEVDYADVKFVKKDGAVVQLGAQQNHAEYAQVRKNNNPPASHLPSYNAHMQRTRRPAPEPPTEYAEVRPK